MICPVRPWRFHKTEWRHFISLWLLLPSSFNDDHYRVEDVVFFSSSSSPLLSLSSFCCRLALVLLPTVLLCVDWRHVYIYTCDQCGHNVSLATFGSGFSDQNAIGPHCVLIVFTPARSHCRALGSGVKITAQQTVKCHFLVIALLKCFPYFRSYFWTLARCRKTLSP